MGGCEMVTYYVIYDTFARVFVRQGRNGLLLWTADLSAAKHFTSQWSADNYLRKGRGEDLCNCIVKKIQRY